MLPLFNKKILITRSLGQSTAFADKIEQLGGIPVLFPLFEITPINTELLTKELTNNQFDWIVFTSIQSVNFFFAQNVPVQNNIKIAAVGNSTEKALQEKGITVDFVPTQFIAKQLAKEIPVLSNQHIFIPRSNIAKNDIIEILEQRGCTVSTLSIYQNSAIQYDASQIAKLNNQDIDFITFTSGSAVRSFVGNRMSTTHQKIICIGPETAKVAIDLGLTVDGVANPHNLKGIFNKIIALISQLSKS